MGIATVLTFCAIFCAASGIPMPEEMITALNAPDMMRMQQPPMEGPAIDIQVHQVAIGDYPLLQFLQQWSAYGSKCMKQVGIEIPDFGINMGGDLIPESGDGSSEREPEATTTAAPGDTTVESPPMVYSSPFANRFNPLTALLHRYARRFEMIYGIWKGRVDNYRKIADSLVGEPVNKFLDSLTKEQYQALSKCFMTEISTEMKDKIQAEWGPIEAFREKMMKEKAEKNAT